MPAATDLQEFVARRTTDVRLHDGLLIRIRPILPEDRRELRRGYEQLSQESRRRRFLSPPGHLSKQMLDYLTGIDYRDHLALVAFAIEDPGAPGIAVARYVRLADEPDTAEAAVTVVDAYQGRGVGTILMQALTVAAMENGLRRFSAYVLAANPVLDMARAAQAEVTPDEPGVVRVVVDLPAAAGEFRDTALHRLFRSLARGELGLRTGDLRSRRRPRAAVRG